MPIKKLKSQIHCLSKSLNSLYRKAFLLCCHRNSAFQVDSSTRSRNYYSYPLKIEVPAVDNKKFLKLRTTGIN